MVRPWTLCAVGVARGDHRRMTDSLPARPGSADGSRPTVLLGDVTASSVTAWSVLGELGPPPSLTRGDGGRQPGPGAPAPAPTAVEPVREPEPRPEQSRERQSRERQARERQPRVRGPESREQGQQREQRAQRDRQVVAQRARDEDTRQRQLRPGMPPGSRPAERPGQRPAQAPGRAPGLGAARRGPGQPSARPAPARQGQSTVTWTAQPTARGAPQRSTSAGPGGRAGPPARLGARSGAGPRSERSRVSPARIVGLVVVVVLLAGRCLNGLT